MPPSEFLLPHFHRTHRHCYPPQAISLTVQTDILWMESRSVCWAGRGILPALDALYLYVHICTAAAAGLSLDSVGVGWIYDYGAIQLSDMR